MTMFQSTKNDAKRVLEIAREDRRKDREEDARWAAKRDRKRAGKDVPNLAPLADVRDLKSFLNMFESHMTGCLKFTTTGWPTYYPSWMQHPSVSSNIICSRR